MSWTQETIQLDYNFLNIVVEGSYRKPEEDTNDYQGCSSEFEIDKIRLLDDSQNLYQLFDEAKWMNDLSNLVIKLIEE